VWNDINALNRTVNLASETPDAVLLVGNHRLVFGVIPPHYVHKTCFDASSATGAFFKIDFYVGTHSASKTEWILQLCIDAEPDSTICKKLRGIMLFVK
jgi:hypothetical protein